MSVKLIKPTIELEDEYMDMIREWKAQEGKLIPWVLGFDASDLPEGMVEHSTYWLVNENNRILGAVNIRHKLNEKLLQAGGHIGYGIRPSERRKGNASEALSQSLNIARSLGIHSALVVCDKNNVGSAKTIQKNGGVLENEVEKDGEVMQRYWIDIE